MKTTMKKIVTLSLIMILVSFAASAQVRAKGRMVGRKCATVRNITPFERHNLRKDVMRQRTAQRIAKRDGVVTPIERVRIHRLKADTRRDAFRYSHNNRRRF